MSKEHKPSDFYSLEVIGERQWKRGPIQEVRYQIAPKESVPDDMGGLEELNLLSAIIREAFAEIIQRAPAGI